MIHSRPGIAPVSMSQECFAQLEGDARSLMTAAEQVQKDLLQLRSDFQGLWEWAQECNRTGRLVTSVALLAKLEPVRERIRKQIMERTP